MNARLRRTFVRPATTEMRKKRSARLAIQKAIPAVPETLRKLMAGPTQRITSEAPA